MSDSETIKKEVDVMLPRITKSSENTIFSKWTNMRDRLKYYGKSKDFFGTIYQNDDRGDDRLFYHSVGNIPTEYVSVNALKEKNSKNLTADHFMIPQFLGKMVYDLSDIYLAETLESFKKFRELSILASRTIKVTKKENSNLADQFRGKGEYKNLGDGYTFLPCSMKDKYELANIRLYDKTEGMEVDMYTKEFFPLYIPQEVLDYEKQFIKWIKKV